MNENPNGSVTTSPELQQKDIAVKRMAGFNGHKYQYQLFRKGVSSKIMSSDIEYNYAVVNVNPIDHTISMQMLLNASSTPFQGIEDGNTYIINVTY